MLLCGEGYPWHWLHFHSRSHVVGNPDPDKCKTKHNTFWISKICKNFLKAQNRHLMIFRLGMETWAQVRCLGNWWDLDVCNIYVFNIIMQYMYIMCNMYAIYIMCNIYYTLQCICGGTTWIWNNNQANTPQVGMTCAVAGVLVGSHQNNHPDPFPSKNPGISVFVKFPHYF